MGLSRLASSERHTSFSALDALAASAVTVASSLCDLQGQDPHRALQEQERTLELAQPLHLAAGRDSGSDALSVETTYSR